jgi:predicted alpha/beta-hydrolase family hydrolase
VKVTTERRTFATPGEVADEVSAVVHRPSRPRRPALLLVHGAGGDLDDPGLEALCEAVAAHGHLVVRANLPFREAGRRTPPRADRSVAGWTALATSVRELAPRTPWVLGGKSYGGRVASMAVAAGLPAAGLLFYGYPLHPPGKPDRLRVDHWPDVPVPCLFLQGDRDPFDAEHQLESQLRRFPRRARVHTVAGGDHSLKVAGKYAPDGVARSAAEVMGSLGVVVEAWLPDVLS